MTVMPNSLSFATRRRIECDPKEFTEEINEEVIGKRDVGLRDGFFCTLYARSCVLWASCIQEFGRLSIRGVFLVRERERMRRLS